MANPLLLAQAAQAVGTPLTDFLVAGEVRKLGLENQRHRNAVTSISANLQRDATTLQEIDTRNASRRADQSIQLQALKDSGEATVSAAAAGVAGGSVQSVMRGLKRSSMNAQYARIENTENAYKELGQQRTNINVSEIFQTDTVVLPKPSLGALLLNIGTNTLNLYEKEQEKRRRSGGNP